MSATMFRSLTVEEVAVVLIVIKSDAPEGMSDDDIQRQCGTTPVLEAIDNMADAGFFVLATDARGRPMPRRWRATQNAGEQAQRQVKTLLRDLEPRIQRTTVPEEAQRLSWLRDFITAETSQPIASASAPSQQSVPDAGDEEPKAQRPSGSKARAKALTAAARKQTTAPKPAAKPSAPPPKRRTGS